MTALYNKHTYNKRGVNFRHFHARRFTFRNVLRIENGVRVMRCWNVSAACELARCGRRNNHLTSISVLKDTHTENSIIGVSLAHAMPSSNRRSYNCKAISPVSPTLNTSTTCLQKPQNSFVVFIWYMRCTF